MGRQINTHTFETSAKLGTNVDNAFACLVYQMLKPCLRVSEQIKADISNGDSRLQSAAFESLSQPMKLDAVMKSRQNCQSGIALPRVTEMTHTQLNLIRALSHSTRTTQLSNPNPLDFD